MKVPFPVRPLILLAFLTISERYALGQDNGDHLCHNLRHHQELDRNTCFANLATAIRSSFPKLGSNSSYPSNARAGADWCYAAESDPITNWWYFSYCQYDDSSEKQDNTKATSKNNTCSSSYTLADGSKREEEGYQIVSGYSSDDGIRVKLFYQKTPSGYTETASVFFALDLLKQSDYANRNARHEFNEITSPIGAGSAVLFPDDNCLELQDFLQTMFSSYTSNWMPKADPLCGTVPCGQTNIGGTEPGKINYVDNIEVSLASKEHPVYWRFNNRTHTISGAIRLLIKFDQCSSSDFAANTCGPYDGKWGFLWIGYGGSGGAA